MVPAPDQRVVERVGKVGRRIDEGAVEIENDGGASEHARHVFIHSCFYVDRGRRPRHSSLALQATAQLDLKEGPP